MPVSKSKVKVQKSKVAVKAVKTPVKKAEVSAKQNKEVHVKETGLKISVYDLKGKVAESITLPKEIFGAPVNKNLIAQAVRVYLANQRRGTVKTKSRGEVKISTRKIYRQKGTGRARHGAASAPIFVGGGIAFGPRPRDYSLKMSKKMKKIALFSALSAKLKDGEIKIVSGLEKIEPKTKNMASVLDKLELGQTHLRLSNANKRVLLVLPSLAKAAAGKDFVNVTKAARNINGLTVTSSNLLNTYEVLASQRILFMKNALEVVKETFLKEK